MRDAHAARLDFSTPHVLRDEAEYDAAVAELDALLGLDPPPAPGTLEDERLEFLTVLVRAYDEKHFPDHGEGLTPQTAVDFALDQYGMTRAELAPLLGGRSRVSEFFSGKRALSGGQMQQLREVLGIPADLLLPASGAPRRAASRAMGKTRKAGTKARPKR